VMLVLFKVLPENAMHEILGVFCLLAYVMVPLHYLAKILVVKFGKPVEAPASPAANYTLSRMALLLPGIFILAMGFTMKPEGGESVIPHPSVKFQDARSETLNGGITKLTTADLLIYVKTIPEFFTGEHTPLLCWRGSGYQFKSIHKERVGQFEIYEGMLVRGEEQLYTAWWYTNGELVTIDQFEWRGRMIKTREKFGLVNVTAKEQMLLHQRLKHILNDGLKVRF